MKLKRYFIIIFLASFSLFLFNASKTIAQQYPEKKFIWQRIKFEDSTWYGRTIEMKAVKTSNNLLIIGGQTLYSWNKRPISISSDYGETWKRYNYNHPVDFIVDSKNRLVIYGDYDSLSQLLHIVDLNSFEQQTIALKTSFLITQLIELSEDNFVAKASDYPTSYIYSINTKEQSTTQILPRDDTTGVYAKLKYVENLFKGSQPNSIWLGSLK
ncbi:MAG TPA: hypothetical protein PKV40_06575 [Candidatus Kapabacteria bacterium]|mgnify:CR=1 FL=1|nr:hypothetical protein [Candidatus Kapabacteria bacterium]